MKKTPLVGRFIKQLNCVNDQTCFSALQHWEFTQRLGPLLVSSPEEFSTSVFSTNPYAATIHRRISEITKMSFDAEVIALQTGVIASVEHLLAYMQEVQNFRDNLVVSSDEVIRDDAEEEQLRLNIARWRGSQPTSQYFRTLGFFRHLRNHYAHVNTEPVPAFANYVRSYGSPLNSFWNNGVTNVHGLDFRAVASNSLTPELTFGIINLLRVCLRHVDEMVAETVTIADMVRWTAEGMDGSLLGQGMASQRLQRKIAARLRDEWGLQLDLAEIEQAIDASAKG